jgi:hypothetical protein
MRRVGENQHKEEQRSMKEEKTYQACFHKTLANNFGSKLYKTTTGDG